MIVIEKLSDVHIRINCDSDVARDLSDLFSFDVPGARFTPAYKNSGWDGKIRLFNTRGRTIYAGLLSRVKEYFDQNDIEYSCDIEDPDPAAGIEEFLSSLDLPFEPYEYQKDALTQAATHERILLLSPTSSGKTFMQYLILRWFGLKALYIVPRKILISQGLKDFKQFGWDPDDMTKLSTKDEHVKESLVFSTWQTATKMPKEFINQFDVIIGDEAHTFSAKSLTTLMERATDVRYRIGCTGSLDGSKCHQLVLEGLFGHVHVVTTTKKMIEMGNASTLDIKCLSLEYPEEICKQIAKTDYRTEYEFIITSKRRNKFIRNLAEKLDGNTLVLFKEVENQGKALLDIMKDSDKKIYYIDGGVKGKLRDAVVEELEEVNNAVLIASYGTFSTGVSVNNLQNVIFASPSKGRIQNIQSIGRVLRKDGDTNHAVLYDISDNMTYKSRENYTYQHFKARLKIYAEEQHRFKTYKIQI